MKNRKYYQSNYVDVLKIITPDLYLDGDLSVSGNTLNIGDALINSHILAAKNVATNINVSAIQATDYSSISNVSGFSRFFIKQNNLTDVTNKSFYETILRPLGVEYSDFDNKEDFKSYLSSILLPNIKLNATSLESTTRQKYASTASGTHVYLIENLGWMYFLNTVAPTGGGFDPSSLVLSALTEKTYFGKPYRTVDGVKDYQTYLWKNYQGLSSIDSNVIPGSYVSGTGTFTSGVQSLEKLHTLIDVEYSDLYTENNNERVKNAFDSYFSGTTLLSGTSPAGPLHKFLQGASLSIYDVNSQIEGINQLNSIEDCPEDLLPYLSNLVGWKLYGNNVESWRRQIRQAARLYKKRGTKSGLVDALNTIILNNPIQTSSLIVELYESYIPNLIYYLLKTESSLFSYGNYTQEVAQSLGIDSYSDDDMDVNIRTVVDNILLRCVRVFPELFAIKNQPFRVNITESGRAWFGSVHQMPNGNWMTGEGHTDESETPQEYIAILGDPAFKFLYRGRTFPIPPWEEEKFYKSCVVTDGLLELLEEELRKFCVSNTMLIDFSKYISSYTTSGSTSNLFLNNGFLFHTSSLQLAPNYDTIIRNSERDDYDYLSLWNGKSSTFDFTVCAGTFSDDLFGGVSALHTKDEILDSLGIVEDFSPAKAMANTKVVLSHTESLSGADSACNSIRFEVKDLAISGALANATISGVDVRGTLLAKGGDFYSGFDDSRSQVSHAEKPVFTREQAGYSNSISNSVVNVSSIIPSALSGVYTRKSLRRRDFHSLIRGAGWNSRDGYNMPLYYNGLSSFSNSYYPLGLIPSSMTYAPTTDHNLSTVYANCESSSSPNSYFGVQVNNTFGVRGNRGFSFSSCHDYRGRDRAPDIVTLLHSINEKKKKLECQRIVELNSSLFSASSSWMNLADSLANTIPDSYASTYRAPILDRRKAFSEVKGIYSAYNQYLRTFLGHALPENLVETYKNGGLNILSHVYGPLYFNGNFKVNGTVIDTSSSVITSSLAREYRINLARDKTNFLETTVADSVASIYIGDPEFRNDQILSSVSFIDTSTPYRAGNEFVVYDLGESEALLGSDNYLIKNKVVSLKSNSHGLPRLRYALRSTSEKNILLPEHEFEIKLKGRTAFENSEQIGGGKVGILIHTKSEPTSTGNNVVFVFTPRHEWEMVNISDLQGGASSISKVLSQYAHIIEDSDISTLTDKFNAPYCGYNSEKGDFLKRVQEKDFREFSVKFHTVNALTKPPFEYATYFNGAAPTVYNGRYVQVHRASVDNTTLSQNYMINVFAVPSQNESEFFLLDEFSVVDSTLNKEVQIPHKYEVPDYTLQDVEQVNNSFIDSNGELVRGNYSTFIDETVLDQPLTGQNTSNTELGNRLDNLAFNSILTDQWWPFISPINTTWTGRGHGPHRYQYGESWGGPAIVSLSNLKLIMAEYFRNREGFCSFGKWSDFLHRNDNNQFNTNIGQQETFFPAYNETAPYGLLSFSHNPGSQVPAELTSLSDKGLPPSHRLLDVNPLGFSYEDDSFTPLVGSYADFGNIFLGAPARLTMISERSKRPTATEGALINQTDVWLPFILDPSGFMPEYYIFSYPEEGGNQGQGGLKLEDYWVDYETEWNKRSMPPQALYHDIRKEDLQNTNYTYSIYVNAHKEGAGVTSAEAASMATSAIITLGTIDGNTYSRATLNFELEDASGVQTNGHSLTNTQSAKIEKIIVPAKINGGPNGVTTLPTSGATWYRVSVSVPYNPTDIDRTGDENLGFRCSIQMYNAKQDGSLPHAHEDPVNGLPFRLFFNLNVWGAALHEGLVAKDWERYLQKDTTVVRLGEPINYGSVVSYRSPNNIFTETRIEGEKRILRNNAGEFYSYNSDISGLNRVTYLERTSEVPGSSPARSFISVSAQDSSGFMYDGDFFIDGYGRILREETRGVVESALERALTTSGVQRGSYITYTGEGSILLEPKELLHLLRYFNSLGQVKQLKASDMMRMHGTAQNSVMTAINSRNPYNSSGTNDVSGGSRINYRVNPDTLHGQGKAVVQGTFENYTSVSAYN